MDKQKQEKIRRFLSDAVMSASVYEAIASSFLKSKGTRDIHVLAAERVAMILLDEAWNDLLRYKQTEPKEDKPMVNPAL